MAETDLFGKKVTRPPSAELAAAKRSAMHGESGYERADHDFYETREPWITQTLLKKYHFNGPVWECACGRLAMSKVLGKQFDVISSDKVDHFGDGVAVPGQSPMMTPGWVQLDFLHAREVLTNGRGEAAQAIITNPPYDLADRFARKGLELMRPINGQVALLLRNEWDCAKNRRDLFEIMPFALKIVLTRRPRWSDEHRAHPRHNFAWFVWDWRAENLRRMAWGP